MAGRFGPRLVGREPRYPGNWLAPSVRDLESKLWPLRALGAAGAVVVLSLPHSTAQPVPLLIVAGAYAAGYAALRLTSLRCPYFCLTLLGLDLTAITLVVEFTGGPQSVLGLMYLYPVGITALAWGLWPGTAAATVAAALHLLTLGPQALWLQAPRDTAMLVLVLYLGALGASQVKAQGGRVVSVLTRRLTLLHERLVGLSTQGSVADLLQQSVDLGRELTGARYAAAAVWNERGNVAHFLTAGMDPAQAGSIGLPPVGAGLLAVVRDAPRPIRLDDAREHPATVPHLPPGHPELGSFLGVPIPALGDWKGAFYMLHKEGGGGFTFDDEHISEMMAAQVGAAVVMRRLVASQRDMYDSLLEMLVSVSDAREHAIKGHSMRVSKWARALAELRGLPEDEVNRIAVAGLLHDIGKIGVPDIILGKPGKLTDEERLLMMAHAALGAAIVEHAGPLAAIAPVVRHHHEWWDGSGYPEGLRAEAIPLGARIVTLADTLDSMTTDRPYRAARSMEDALGEIDRCSGTQFDPSLAALAATVVGRAAPSPVGVAQNEPATLAELHSMAQVAGWKLFTRLSHDLRAVRETPVLAERALSAIVEELAVTTASLSVLEAGGETLRVVAWRGSPCLFSVGSTLPRGKGLMWAALEQGTALATAEMEADPRYRGRRGEGRHSGVFVPLVASAGVQGVLCVHRNWPQTFGEQTVRQLEAVALVVAETLAVAQLRGRLEAAALTDPLTGVGNRRYGLEQLAAACERAGRDNRPCALLMLALDNLEDVNDRFGHSAGDAVLKHAVAAAVQRLRPHHLIARYGGGRFIVILPDTGWEQAQALERRLTAGQRTMIVDGHKVAVPPWSGGIAVWPYDGEEVDALLRASEERLHGRRPGRASRGGLE